MQLNFRWNIGAQILAALALMAMSATRASAAPVLDQVYDAPNNLAAVQAEGFAYCGQTFTAGVSGELARVELALTRGAHVTRPWVITIRECNPLGNVTPTVVATEVLLPEQVPIGGATFPTPPTVVDFASPAFLDAGERFAIVVQVQGTSGSPGLLAGSWSGTTANGYLPGNAVRGFDGINFENNTFDLKFRTFMEVPEPSATIAGLLLTTLALGRRRRRSSIATAPPVFHP